MLTQRQVEILVWMVESGETAFVFSEGYGPASLVASGPAGELQVEASDFREMEHLGLTRWASGETYNLTNEGRLAYRELTTVPTEPRRVGF